MNRPAPLDDDTFRRQLVRIAIVEAPGGPLLGFGLWMRLEGIPDGPLKTLLAASPWMPDAMIAVGAGLLAWGVIAIFRLMKQRIEGARSAD